ncbi:hypothetical protein ABPG72_008989 [Tetrahymena utriculariae]
MKKLCYYQNQIDRAETFWQFLKYSFRFKLIEWWQVCKLLRYTPQGCFYGLIQYLKLLHVFLFFQIKKNDQITQHYENIFTKRFKKSINRLSHNIHSALRKDAYSSNSQKASILPLNSNLQASVNLKESDIENSLTSSHLFYQDKSQPLFNHKKTQSNQGIQNIAEAIFEKKKQEQLIEEFTQEELYQIYRQSTFLQYLSNEKIQGIIQISQIIQFIFESMPQLLIQFINNGQLGIWSGKNSGTLVPPIFCFILSLVSIIISSINLVNYLLQKESLTFIYMQKILSKSQKTQQEEKLVKINDKLNTSIVVVKPDSLTKVSQLRKQIQESLENLNVVLPLIKVSSNSIFQDLSRISFNRIQKLKIDIHGDSIRYPMREFADNLQQMNSIEEIDLKFNGNCFDGIDAKHLSQSLLKISNQKQLQRIEINLKENSIDEQGIEHLNQLAQVEKLVYLNVLINPSSALYVKSDDCQLDETIFEDIIASKNLQYLFINKNIFSSDQQLKYFLNNLKNMNQLNGYQLNFSGYQMTEDILVQLKEFNQTQTQLTNVHLNLVKCGINQENLKTLYEYDGDSIRAYSLNLDFNKSVRDLQIENCKFLNKLKSLEISLQGCKLQNKVGLINNLSQIDNISFLKLNVSDLISNDKQSITYEEFQEYENLVSYDGPQIKNLMMSNLVTLNVDFSYSKMNPEVIKSFIVSLKQSKQIRDLTLNFNKNFLSQDFDQTLGETLENYTELQKISLCLKNTNRGNDISKTLQGLSGLQQITHINLDYSYNYIDQGFFQTEQTWYQNKPNLSSIQLQFQCNNTEEDQSKLFCPIIESNSYTLQNLSLDFCYRNTVYEQEVNNLLTSLKTAQNLQSLKLDLNSFQSTLYQMNTMKKTLQSLKQISNLELLMNSMRIGEKPVAVPMPLQNQQNRQPPFNQMHIQNQQNRQNNFNNQMQQQQFIIQPLNSEKLEIFGQMFDNFTLQRLKLEFYGNYVGEQQAFNIFIQNLNKSNQTMKILELSLGYTEMSNSLLKELFQAIQNMSHLDTLYLAIKFLQTDHLPIALFEKQSMEKLTLCLNSCKIQRECLSQCSQSISKMKKLKEMRIEINRAQLEDSSCVNEFSQCFNKLQGLQTIYLGMENININKESIKALSDNILKEKIKQFRINMSFGQIDQEEQHVLAELLRGFSNLQRLDLKMNNIGMDDQGFKQMIDEIQLMKCLSTFKLRFDGLSITSAGFQKLQSYLSNNTNILSKVTLINKDNQVAPQLIQMENELQQTTKIPYIRFEKN